MVRESHVSMIAAGLLVTSMMAVAFVKPVAADDQWRDECDEQTRTIEPGIHSGTLSPDDTDAFRVKNMDAGDFLVVKLQSTVDIYFPRNRLTQVNGGPIHELDWATARMVDAGNRTLRIYTKNTEDCIVFRSRGNTAGEWRMAFALDEAKAPTMGGNTSVNLEAEIERLRNQIDILEQRLAQLENATGNNTTQETLSPPIEITGTHSEGQTTRHMDTDTVAARVVS